VWLWLRDGLSWRGQGRQVAEALRAALDQPDSWVIEPAAGEVLARVTADLLDGPVGEFVRSHGGTVSVQRTGEVVTVQLGGACEHCPAAEQTLRQRLLDQLRQRCPELTELSSARGTLRLALAAPG
jgi:Fe/S biogenesis protein NfuA